MAYFVTGATGFIGRYLVERLLAHGDRVFVLVRPESLPKLEALRGFWGARASSPAMPRPCRASSPACTGSWTSAAARSMKAAPSA